MLSHRALLANIEQAARRRAADGRGPTTSCCGVLPLFHVYGLNAVLGQVLRQRARLVLVDGFDPEGSLDVVEDEAVTVLPVAPPVLRVLDAACDDLRRAARPGSGWCCRGRRRCRPELVDGVHARGPGSPVHQGYGLTEAAPVVTSTLCSGTAKPGSVGAALPGDRDPAGRRATATPPRARTPGRSWSAATTSSPATGPTAPTARTRTAGGATGDVGFLDGDGDLFLVDRLKELVIVSGFNVYPSEVEDVIAEVDGVAEAAVIGSRTRTPARRSSPT